MATKKGPRDLSNLQRADLLQDYLQISNRRPGALIATALRTRSTSMRDILVYASTGSTDGSEALKESCDKGVPIIEDVKDARSLADLGRLVILQNLLEGDLAFGEHLLSIANDSPRLKKLSRKNALVLIQHLISTGKLDEAAQQLERYPAIDRDYFGYLHAELLNPFTFGTEDTYDEWLLAFNQMFASFGISPVSVSPSEASSRVPFDRLTSTVDKETDFGLEQPLVSVVLSAFRPDRDSLLTSVKSILNQTWTNLELLIVDDCSGEEFSDVFDRIESLDERIRVIHSTVNRGTYGARNLGYGASRGHFIAGQDDDDWSHPERIARQVQYLNDNPHDIACRVTAVRCDENLGRVRTGYSPLGENASSLMVRREGYEAVGKFIEARKAADTEFHFRLSAATGRPVGRVRAPLSIIRIMPDSLSRGDFSSGWKHSSRRSFRSSYEYWHRTSSRDELLYCDAQSVEVKIPRRFSSADCTSIRDQLDVVFAGNWEKSGGPQKSMLEEIFALKEAGYRVGILNLEAARFMQNNIQVPLNDDIQKLVNEGYVDEVHYDDEVKVELLILRYPPILQFFTHDRSSLVISSMLIIANQAPSELDGRDVRYLVHDCQTNARTAFGVEPIWVPQGPQVRQVLTTYLSEPVLSPFDMPGIIDLPAWWRERTWYRSLLPVIGRHSRDDKMKWPEDSELLENTYPTSGCFDIRIMGGASVPLGLLGVQYPPPAWTVYERDEISVADFLYSLDYFVFFQHHKAIEAFGRAILEALAAGIVVILPYHFQEVFGAAAVYSDARGVQEEIKRLHSNFNVYQAQLQRARSVLESRFSYKSYIERINGILQVDGAQEDCWEYEI